MQGKVKFAVIGGSGLYQLENAKVVDEVDVETPFGKPSDKITIVDIDGRLTAFLPRHGKGHRYTPTEIPVQANIWALKWLGVERIIAVSAVGSLKEEIKPGDFVITTQFIDRTKSRPLSFFGNGIVGHIPFADPTCPDTSRVVKDVIEKWGKKKVHFGGTYVCIEGPQFSTRAESNLYRSWGADIVGMTGIPEAKLAREAEICYAQIALATDYDCWHEGHEDVTVEMVVKTMQENVAAVKEVLPLIIKALPEERNCVCVNAAQTAVMTAREYFPLETMRKLELFYSKYWK